MKIEEILAFALVVFLAIIFVGAVSLSVNTLQATEMPDAEYIEPTEDVPEIVELIPESTSLPTPTDEITISDIETEEEIVVEEEPQIREEEISQIEEEENEVEIEVDEESKIEEEKEKEEPLRWVDIVANIPIGSVVNEGDIITMTAILYGFEDVEVTYQWYRLVGADWIPIEGAIAQSYSFAATEETVDCWYNVYVTIIE